VPPAPAELVVDVLASELRYQPADLRAQAAKALGRIGPAASEAIPELTRLLDDESARVRKAAGEAVSRIGGIEP